MNLSAEVLLILLHVLCLLLHYDTMLFFSISTRVMCQFKSSVPVFRIPYILSSQFSGISPQLS